MPLDLSELDVTGLAIPGSYVRHELEGWLIARNLLDTTLEHSNCHEASTLVASLATPPIPSERIAEALRRWLGYHTIEHGDDGSMLDVAHNFISYRLVSATSAAVLRIWVLPRGTALDTSSAAGVAYRYRAAAVAERQLRELGERIGLVTNGQELRVVFADVSEHESALSLSLVTNVAQGAQCDALRVLQVICGASGLSVASSMLEAARVWRRRLVRALRISIRNGAERFIQALLDLPENRQRIAALVAQESLAKDLFHETLILVYRLLFVLRHATPRIAQHNISFAVPGEPSHSGPLACIVDAHAETSPQTGTSRALITKLLERLRSRTGRATERETLAVAHELFGRCATPTLETLAWSDRALDVLVEGLLSVTPSLTETPQALSGIWHHRVGIEGLDIEDLGHVYEGLLDLEPGIAQEPMCRLRGTKLEVVLPLAMGEEYRRVAFDGKGGKATAQARSTHVTFVEAIAADSFYLRVGLGRKTSGSYYTPKAFVQFLVRETLSSQLEARSPVDDPNPAAILSFKVIDPAMGSGHFLVEACRYLGEALFEAYCLCRQLERAARAAVVRTRSCEAREAVERRVVELANRIASVEALAPELAREVAPFADAFADSTRQKALNCCRRLIACHCLYGIDKDRLAVALARAALGLVACADAPLSVLNRHLIVGDCLTGASLEHLVTMPRTQQAIVARHGASLDTTLRDYVTRQLQSALREHSDALRADRAPSDVHDRREPCPDEDPLSPMRQIAAAYIGGVMLESGCDDAAYAELVWSIATGSSNASDVHSATLRKMVELGREAVAFELCFPEVFFPSGNLEDRGGFNAVLGNPPWDAIKFNTKEFLATFDLRVLEAPTKRERDQVEVTLTQSLEIARKFSEYKEHFAQFKRSNDRIYSHQKVMIDGDLAGRQLDRYRLVIERASQIVARDGFIGLVVPSSFHTAAGAAGVRRLLTEPFRLLKYISFINDLKHFDIAAGIEFGLLLAAGPATPSRATAARFRLRDPEALACSATLNLLEYPVRTLCAGNPYLTFPTVANGAELEALATCRCNKQCFRDLEALSGVEIRSTPTSVHMTHESKHFIPVRDSAFASAPISSRGASGAIVLHEGATFGRYTDLWSEPPRLAIDDTRVASSERWRVLAGHYKVALRAIVGHSKDKCVSTLLPPGCLVANSALVEGAPEQRTNASALMIVALLNSNVFSWLLGFYADLNVNLFALRYLPVPSWPFPSIVAHNALRLCCNHSKFTALWREQLGDVWREPEVTPQQWPILVDASRRRHFQSINDAIFAAKYGLNRQQYGNVLDAMSHSDQTNGPAECLAAFDELHAYGFDAFAKKYDPYWDLPLVTNLPSPHSACPLGPSQ